MMYNNKLAVALKTGGKVLREFEDTVYVPFGAEYSILVKNLNTVRALVSIDIDGTDVGDGDQFVVHPNTSLDLERFLKNGNVNQGNRFKFIERTGSIEKHRGIGVEDGLVRVEFKFEKVYKPVDWDYHVCKSPSPRPFDGYYGSSDPYGGDLLGNIRSNAAKSFSTADSIEDGPTMDLCTSPSASAEYSAEIPPNDAGITVPGSVSDQQFKTVSSFPTESETHVIVLKMLGETEDNKRVKKAVTVKTKQKCPTCGRTNKATAKFCTECGTSLTIV